jgi:hypothetical protein
MNIQIASACGIEVEYSPTTGEIKVDASVFFRKYKPACDIPSSRIVSDVQSFVYTACLQNEGKAITNQFKQELSFHIKQIVKRHEAEGNIVQIGHLPTWTAQVNLKDI